MNRYERLALSNADLIARLEGVLKSLSYMLPGRFDDSILVSEIRTICSISMLTLVVYAVLKCFKHFNDAIYYKHYKHAATTSWNQYLAFLKRQSPMAGALINCLLFVRFVEVPTELIVKRFAGLESKYVFAAVLESMLKGTIWWLTEYRMVPNKLHYDSVRPRPNQAILFPELNEKHMNDIEIRMMAMDRCCEGKTVEERTRNFIRDNAPKTPPEVYFSPAVSVLERSRELAHICRPAVYAVFMLFAINTNTRKRWQLAGWIITLCMDYFSCWPEVQMVMSNSTTNKNDLSVEEVEERQFRLLRMGLYLFREPFFADHTKPWLDSVIDRFDGWRLLSPFVTTARAYLALCEDSLLYTND